MVTVLCVGMLLLQKLRLQTRLDDNRWWLIKYSDIVIIKEPKVGPSARGPSGRRVQTEQ